MIKKPLIPSHARLLAAIEDERTRRAVGKLLVKAVAAIRGMSALDSTFFTSLEAGGMVDKVRRHLIANLVEEVVALGLEADQDAADQVEAAIEDSLSSALLYGPESEEDSVGQSLLADLSQRHPPAPGAEHPLLKSVLEGVLDEIFLDLHGLIDQVLALGQTADGSVQTDDEEFDLGAFDEPARAVSTEFDEGDIDNAISSLTRPTPRGGRGLAEVRDAVFPLAQGLQAQLTDLEARFRQANQSGHYRTTVRELDEGCESLREGVLALVRSLFGVFFETVEDAALVPGFQSTLAVALSVRRAIAELASRVRVENDQVQRRDGTQGDAVSRIRDLLGRFFEREIFCVMRAGDRLEMMGFSQRLGRADVATARTLCEGFTRYLESLGLMLNQREVLLTHDREVARSVRETLQTARELRDISPATAIEQVRVALTEVEKLRGWCEPLDQRMRGWRLHVPDLTVAEVLDQIIETLLDLTS